MSRKDDLLGGTGQFPLGKMSPDDLGELRFAIGSTPDGKIIIDFGKHPVDWIGMPKGDAINMAKLILKHCGAKKIEIEF